MLTGYQSVASGLFHCSLTEGEFRVTQTKAVLFRGGEGEDAGILQHLMIQTQEGNCFSNCALCVRVCLSFKSQRITPLSAPARNDELTLARGDSPQSGCHSDSHSSFQFHYHQSVQIELCLHLSREQISTWDEHRWADPIPPCSSKSELPPPPASVT